MQEAICLSAFFSICRIIARHLFYWYQQLVAESLGKKGKGFFPIISNLPKDNHSLMQLYLDGNNLEHISQQHFLGRQR